MSTHKSMTARAADVAANAIENIAAMVRSAQEDLGTCTSEYGYHFGQRGHAERLVALRSAICAERAALAALSACVDAVDPEPGMDADAATAAAQFALSEASAVMSAASKDAIAASRATPHSLPRVATVARAEAAARAAAADAAARAARAEAAAESASADFARAKADAASAAAAYADRVASVAEAASRAAADAAADYARAKADAASAAAAYADRAADAARAARAARVAAEASAV
jgi:hypothetical protein